ncbi:MAG: rpe [Candidatus Saccharibacteria bacterium]|nr:rpe [Candidatus Saccharibacteria bacterium]
MTTICPTITAEEPHGYRAQVERIEPFAVRWHIDVADGEMAPRQLIGLDKLWWPGNVQVDLHVMYKNPEEHLELFIVQHPRLIIIQAEAEGDFDHWAATLHRHGIEVGVALLPETPVSLIASAIESIDHVLIFSGNLGYQGNSHADLGLLDKVAELRKLKPLLEIGWDGGVNDENARQLAEGGIDVLNVGSFIHGAHNPGAAYATLKEVIS